MRLFPAALVAVVLALTSHATFLAQSPQSAQSRSVPRLVSLSGVFRPADGQPVRRVEVVTLAIYADESAESPLWQEVQSIGINQAGRYTLMLGATEADGVPLEVFASGEARWLGTKFNRPGEVEGPRVRLTSVPYALRAADADTLGGRPASEYVLAPSGGEGRDGAQGQSGAAAVSVVTPLAVNPGTPNFLAKYVNPMDVGDSAVYEAGGSVGIGTTTPRDFLHVRFSNTNGGFTGYAVQNLGTTGAPYSGMLFYDQNGVLGQFQGFNNLTHEYRVNNVARDSSGNINGSINLMLGGVSRLWVGSSGVGIGTAIPSANLEVASRTGTSLCPLPQQCDVNILSTAFNTTNYTTPPTATSGGTFTGSRARGTEASPAAVQNQDVLAFFNARGRAPDFWSNPMAGVAMLAAENWTNTAQGTQMRFSTAPLGTTTLLERMSIDAAGEVGIGTNDAVDTLQVVGDIRVGTSGTNGCIKDFGGNSIAGTCASDARFKTEVTSFTQVLSPFTALRPVHYYWRAADFPDRHFGNSRTYGLIAQEVEQVLPELVVTGKDGFKAIDYSKLPLLTVQAVKELKARNDALEDRIAELEQLVKELRMTTRAPATTKDH